MESLQDIIRDLVELEVEVESGGAPPTDLRERIARLRKRAEGLLRIVEAKQASGLPGATEPPGEA
jgi:hypothetical protein